MLGKTEGRRRRGRRGQDGWVASLIDGHEFEQGPGDGEAQGILECCHSRGLKEPDSTEQGHSNKRLLKHNSLLKYDIFYTL